MINIKDLIWNGPLKGDVKITFKQLSIIPPGLPKTGPTNLASRSRVTSKPVIKDYERKEN